MFSRQGDAEWQGVSGTKHKFLVYSAYCDDRDRPLVRVIAATKTKKPDKVGTHEEWRSDVMKENNKEKKTVFGRVIKCPLST